METYAFCTNPQNQKRTPATTNPEQILLYPYLTIFMAQ